MIALLWNLALAFVLPLHCYCGDNVKYGVLSKHLLKKSHSNDKLFLKK